MLLCIYAHVYSKQLYLVLPLFHFLVCYLIFPFLETMQRLKIPIATDMEPKCPVNLLLNEIYRIPVYPCRYVM